MSTPFSFETIFQAPSVEAVLAAYFDPDHLAAQDKVGELTDRKTVEDQDTPDQRNATWTVRAARPLPIYARPFVDSPNITYRETMKWRKAASEIDLVILPQILGGRVSINAVYKLSAAGERQVRRVYTGEIKVDVKLVSGKIERGILDEIQKGMPAMRDCTQKWLLNKNGS